MTTPAERRELMDDIAAQTEDWARSERAEYYDAADVGYGDPPPHPSEYADLTELDRRADLRDERRRAEP